jgi:hypothetical protein
VPIIDLVFIRKDADGTVSSFELDELDEAPERADLDVEASGLLAEDDALLVAEEPEPESPPRRRSGGLLGGAARGWRGRCGRDRGRRAAHRARAGRAALDDLPVGIAP